MKRRKRIRPCLKVCQTVEERCPYLLPGDRSPGYNTQYAGEPTFLCNGEFCSFRLFSGFSFFLSHLFSVPISCGMLMNFDQMMWFGNILFHISRLKIKILFIIPELLPINIDPNIPETGEQLAKSNNGPDDCCYEYCSSISVGKGVCAYCDSIEPDPADDSRTKLIEMKAPPAADETKILQQRYDSSSVAKLDQPPQTCHLMPGLSLTSTRCEIPYYASSFDTSTLHPTTTSTPVTVSTSTTTESTWI